MTKLAFPIVLLIAVTGAANAQSTSSSRPEDAKTGGNETTFPLVAKFQKLDTNKDGKLSIEEFRKMDQKRGTALFKSWNTNKDGYLSLEEFTAGSAIAEKP